MTKVILSLSLFFLTSLIAFAQPGSQTTLTCGTASSFTLTNSGFTGDNPTTTTGSCGPCCYSGSDLDGDGDQDVSFSVENSKWFKYCNSTGSSITTSFAIDEVTNVCNVQGAIFVGSSTGGGTIDCSNSEFQEFGSNAQGNADGFSFSNVTIPAGQCAYIMVDGYGGATCGGLTITAVCPVLCTTPTTMTAGSDIAICEGSSSTINATVSGGTVFGGVFYQWTPSTGLSCTNCQDPIANPSGTTTYTLKACNDGAGTTCCTTDQVIVTVTPTFIANAGPNIVACAPSTVTIGGSPTGPAGSTYVWAVSGTANSGIAISAGSTTANPTVTINAGATGSESYQVTVTNGPCVRTDIVMVTVGPLSVNAGVDDDVCVGSSLTLGGSPTGPAGSTYNWTCTSCAGITLSSNSIANPSVTPTTGSGTATYTVTATLGSCSNSDAIVVTINQLPVTPTATASPASLCAGVSSTLTAAGGAGAGTYRWYTASTGGTLLGSANTLVVSPVSTTTYYIESTNATTGCISIRGSVTVTVNATPVANAGVDVDICSGQTYTLAGSVTNPGACAPLQTWSLISGTGTFSNANSLTAVFTPTSSGTITLQLSPCTPGGCTPVNDNITLTVNPTPTVVATVQTDTLCTGLITDLDATTTGGTPFPPTVNTQSFSSATGPFSIPNNDCSTGLSIPISVSGVVNPSVSVGGTTVTVCLNVSHNKVQDLNLQLCSPGGGTCITLVPEAGATQSGNSYTNTCFTGTAPNDITTGSSPYTGTWNPALAVSMDDLAGASTDGTWNLKINDCTGGSSGSAGQWSITFNTPVVNNAYTYLWSSATGVGSTISAVTTYSSSGEIGPVTIVKTITATDSKGCSGNATASIFVPAPPTATVSGSATICSGNSTNMSIALTGISPWIITYTLNGGSPTTVTGITSSPYLISTSTAGTYAVTNISDKYCSGTFSGSAVITVTTPPTAAISYSGSPFCNDLSSGQTVTLTGTGTFTGGTYSSTAGLTLNSSTGTIVPSTSLAGNYTITYTLAASGGCPIVTSTSNITINGLPTAIISGGGTICSGASDTLVITLTGTAPWRITYNDGVSLTTITGIATSPFTFFTNSPATYSLDTVKNVCYGTVSGSAIVKFNPPLSVDSITTTCSGGKYIVSFDIIGGDTATYTVNANQSNIFTGTTNYYYISDSITSGTSYSFILTDAYNCNPQIVSGTFSCGCSIQANLSGGGKHCSDTLANPIIITIDSAMANAPIGLIYTLNGINDTIGLNANASGIANYTITSPVPGTYTFISVYYSIASFLGSTSGNANVIVTTLPDASFTYGSINYCDNSPSASAIVTGTSGAFSATSGLNFSNPAIGAIDFTSSPSSVTPYTIYNIIAAANGCKAVIDSFQVYINPSPVVTANSTSTNVCAGDSIMLFGGGALTYVWDNGATNSAYFIPTSSILYTVTGTEGNNCSNSASIQINFNTLPTSPTILASGPVTFCEGTSTLVLASSSASSYSWVPGGLNNDSLVITSSGNYAVFAIDVNNCKSDTASNTISVNILPLPASPSITSSGPLSFCEGASSLILISTTAAGYSWVPTGIDNDSLIVTATGSYQVYAINGNGCKSDTASTSINVTVFPLPPSLLLSANGPTNMCDGDTIVLSCTSASSYSWVPAGNNINSLTVTSSGTYYVYAIDGNSCKSDSSNSITVVVNTLPSSPTITANGPVSFCLGDSVLLTSTSSTSFSWIPFGIANDSIYATTIGTYSVFAVDGNGCKSDTASNQITVLASPPTTPTITTIGATSFCEGDSVLLISSSSTGNVWNPGLSTNDTLVVYTSNSYSVTVGNNGCEATSATTLVTVNSLPLSTTVSASGATTFCLGDSVILTSTPANQYSWTPSGITTSSITVTSGGTYSVYAIDGNGCKSDTASNSINVTVNTLPSAPTISLSGSNQFCEGDSTILVSSSSNSYSWIPGGSNNDSLIVNTNGSYAVFAIDGNGCKSNTASNSIVITVNPLPGTPVITSSGPNTFCEGDSVVLISSSNSGYSWIPSGSNNDSINVKSSGTYSVYAIDANGCKSNSASAAQLVTVNALPLSPTISANGPLTFCDGDSVTLSSTSSTNYSWIPSGNSSNSIVVNTTGSYSVFAIDANNCKSDTASNVLTVTKNNLPTVTASNNGAVCFGDSIQLNGGVNGMNNYSWSGPNSYTNLTQNPLVTNNANSGMAGNYTLTIIDGNNCKNQATTIVLVNSLPNASAANNGPVCVGASLNLTCSNAGLTNYSWTGPNAYSSSSQNATVTSSATNTMAGNYILTITDNNGCKDTAITNVTINSGPIITATNNGPVCAGSALNLNATSDVISTYNWSGPNSFINTSQNPSVSTSSTSSMSGNYMLVVSSAGCSTTATTTVTVNALPTITTSGTMAVCTGSPLILTGGANGMSSYNWSGPSAFTSTLQNPQVSATVNSTAAGLYTLTITDANNCTNQSTSTVTVNGLPTITAATSQSVICEGSSITLNGSGGITYLWSNGALNNTAFMPTTSQSYSVTGTDANNCSNTANILVTVNPRPVITASVSAASVCPNQQVTLTGNGAITYVWSNGVMDGVAFTPTSTTTYSLSGTGANGCIGTTTKLVTVNPLDNSTFLYTTNSECTGIGNHTLLNVPSSPGMFIISPTGLSINSNTGVIDLNLSTPNVYNITYQTSGACPVTSPPSTMTILQGVKAGFTPSVVEAQINIPITFTNATTPTNANFAWNFGDNSTIASELNPSHSFTASGNYQIVLTASSSAGCSDTESVVIIIKEDFTYQVPNIFTPNGDGKNDQFELIKPQGIESLECTIYDRWGLIVNSYTGAKGSWAGITADGKSCADGIYYYLLNITKKNGEIKQDYGFITLIR